MIIIHGSLLRKARTFAHFVGQCRRRRATEQRDELASFHVRGHSITSSARASRLSGTVRPSAFAVLRLITSSNLVGCSTGRSAGLAPFRILSTYAALRR